MLVPVREIAAARFEQGEDAPAVRRAHADFYVDLAVEAEPLLRGPTQLAAVDRLEAERDNIRSGYRHLIAIGDADVVAEAVWRPSLYWWIRSLLPEARAWMEEVLEAGAAVADRTRAIALSFSSWVSVCSRIRGRPGADDGERGVVPRRGRRVRRGVLALSILSLGCTYGRRRSSTARWRASERRSSW